MYKFDSHTMLVLKNSRFFEIYFPDCLIFVCLFVCLFGAVD
jgi:hypothetical protein